jgi:chromosome segregation ATPase
MVVSERSPPREQAAIAPAPDVAFDARLLADYGDPPQNWLLSPMYAWRVLKRRRELKTALTGRRDEAARASSEAEDALVSFAERVRATVEKSAPYRQALDELRNAEELLRSRDRVLAAEQDAQNARLSQVDARLSTLDAELALAIGEERAIATELSAAQNALAREDARLKRAEIELRAAQQRDSNRSGDDG